MKRSWIGYLLAAVLLHVSLAHADESAQDKIKRALSVAPPSVAKAAKVMDMDAQGKMTVLREGTNGFTCFPGHPGVVGDVAMCADEASMQWISDFIAHKPKPTNTQPGVTAAKEEPRIKTSVATVPAAARLRIKSNMIERLSLSCCDAWK